MVSSQPVRTAKGDTYDGYYSHFSHKAGTSAASRKQFSAAFPASAFCGAPRLEDIAELEAKYPDAAFALMISDNLFVGDRELNEIHQKAYTAILRGESISGVRFRYDFDTESYLKRHMWD